MNRFIDLRHGAVAAMLMVAQCAALAQSGEDAPANSGGIGGMFSSLGKSVGSLFESVPEKPLLATLTTGAYVPSNEAIGEERDVESNRVENFGLVPIKVYQDYANRIYSRLKEVSGVTGVPGSVYLLAGNELAAKSSPDGNLYLSIGWVNTIESEDELAALLAHELGHVLLHHHDSTVLSTAQKKLQYVFALGSELKNNLDRLGQANASNMTPGQTKSLQRMQLLVELTDTIMLPAWTRSQEMNADRIGLDLLRKAGYSSSGLADFLEHISSWDQKQAAARKAKQTAIQVEMDSLLNSGGMDAALKLGLDETGKGLKEALMSQHESGEKRIEELHAYREKHHSDWPRSEIRSSAYAKITEDRAVRPVLDAYDRTFKAMALIEAGSYEKAYAELQPVTKQGAAAATHAMPNYEMYTAMVQLGRKDALGQLVKSFFSSEPAWKPYAEAIRYESKRGNRAQALKIASDARQRFRDAPALVPKFVEVFAELDYKEELQKELTTCTAVHVVYRDLCHKKSKRK